MLASLAKRSALEAPVLQRKMTKKEGLKAPPSPHYPTTTPNEPRTVKAKHEERDETTKDETKKAPIEAFDPLDPASRRMAQIAPPMAIAPPAATNNDVSARARVSMEDLLPQLVRRIAWAGDRRKGTVQLEIGAGRHEGTTVTVHADDGRVRVELHGRDPSATEDLRQRLDARLRRHGLDVESVT